MLLPMKLERLRVYRRPSSCLWSQVRIQPVNGKNKKSLNAEVRLFDETGNLVALVEGLSLRRVSRVALRRILQQEEREDLDNLLYENYLANRKLDPLSQNRKLNRILGYYLSIRKESEQNLPKSLKSRAIAV